MLSAKPLVIPEDELAKFNPRLSATLDRGDASIIPGAELARKQLSETHGRELPPIIITRPIRQLSELRSRDLGRIVTVEGLVKIVTEPLPRSGLTSWQCARCGCILEIRQEGLRNMKQPIECFKESGGCGRAASSTRFTRVYVTTFDKKNDRWIEVDRPEDERWLEIQEPPGLKDATDRPRSRLVRALGDRFADMKILPGDVVVLTGVLLPDDEENKKLTPMTFIDAHHIDIQSISDAEITPDDFAAIKQAASLEDPLTEAIIPSIAPHIVGRDEAKKACACSLFSGYDFGSGRETIHTLLAGDAATAKTQIARSALAFAPRGNFVAAKSATEAGLTVTADRDPAQGNRWTLVAGALSLADMGVCVIDEVGELKPESWKALEEAMEDGKISPAKAGITTQFNARTAIIACGNAKGGKQWDESDGTTICDKLGKMPNSTLTRFDFVFIIKDDPAMDDEATDAMARRHGLGSPSAKPPLTDQQLRAYILYARHTHPILTPEAVTIFKRHLAEIRPVPGITLRTFGSYIRIGQALARMRLSKEITAKDAERAVRIHHAGWAPVIKDYNMRGGATTLTQKDRMQIVLDVITELCKVEKSAESSLVITRSRDAGLSSTEIMHMIDRLKHDGIIYEITNGVYKVT
jgi:DNA replicative helicase MCM subunit Mcm2 (Cdc46/Mcm family)